MGISFRAVGARRTSRAFRALPAVLALVACTASTPRDADGARPAARATIPPPAPATTTVNEAHAAPPAEFVLPDNWSTLDRDGFARALPRWLDGERAYRVDDASLVLLSKSLARGDETSVRAVLVLARTRDPRAGEALLALLESRAGSGSRALSADVVAAAAFARGAVARDAGVRLETLASGSRPHPDLEVRVECAASALASGRDAVIPFLFDVMREGTTRALEKPDWTRIDWRLARMEWIQSRAADALARRARVRCEWRAELGVPAREREVERLEALLHSPQREHGK
jgi:hypothetical protein